MSRLLARIMLALLMLPLAAAVYTFCIVMLMEITRFRREEIAFLAADLVTALFVAAYWTLLWRATVRWSARRVLLTVIAAFAALAVGAVLGGVASMFEDSFGLFIGGVFAILLWLVATVFVWRETAGERSRRVRGAGAEAIVCPQCGYNMTGLELAACPECGARFTVDELVALQPSRERGGGNLEEEP